MPWEDSLDDFEKQLAADKAREREGHKESRRRKEHHSSSRDHHRHYERHHSHRHHHDEERFDDKEGRHRHKRQKRGGQSSDDRGNESNGRGSKHEYEHEHKHRTQHRKEHVDNEAKREENQNHTGDQEEKFKKEHDEVAEDDANENRSELKRDAWMEPGNAPNFEYVRQGKQRHDESESRLRGSPKANFELKIHEAELNKHHLLELAEGQEAEMKNEGLNQDAWSSPVVEYTFGDSGSRWRMLKLRNVYREASESGRSIEEVAERQYGSLRAFDEAREEEIELDRRERYGTEYVGGGKTKPSGNLYKERRLEADGDAGGQTSTNDGPQGTIATEDPRITSVESAKPASTSFDPTVLNRLRAQLMKARLKGLPEAAQLERDYEQAQRAAEDANGLQNNVIVLNVMENRMLAGRSGVREETKPAANRRARERGQVEENEDMSIEDMVREERRSRGIFGNNEDRRFAERIAKQGGFVNDLDYMDDNASKLAKRVHQSDTALRATAIEHHKNTNSALDSCPLCHHEDRFGHGENENRTLPVAPIVSLGHRTYLTLPTIPEIKTQPKAQRGSSENIGGAILVPITHHENLLHCDDDEWEELRNFMKCLIRMYDSLGLGVIFYENAAHTASNSISHKGAPRRHAALTVVPLPRHLASNAPAFFREAFLSSDDEWAQHRKVIDTTGSRNGFRKNIAREAPYFHVWTSLDGGMAHIVEDTRKWPRGDLFAREVIGGGMLGLGPEIWRRQGRWDSNSSKDSGGRTVDEKNRVEAFRRTWNKFDWTKMLVSQE